MYGAYYPYLYGRGAARYHAPHFQYDRFNVQSGGGGGGGHGVGGHGGGDAYSGALSTGSGSSGAQSPAAGGGGGGGVSGSPPHAAHAPRLRAKEEELSAHGRASADGGGSSESESECGAAGGGGGGGGGACGGGGGGRARAQYVSANCVVFTHYSGDVAAVVDEHFSRALAIDKHKESVPMSSRQLPASFFNAAAAGGACAVDLYEYDPWHQHYSGYGHAMQAHAQAQAHAHASRHAAEYHAAAAASAAHHNMGYGGLLLPRAALPQYKPVEWPAHAHAHTHAHAHPHAQHHLDPAACAPYSYPAVPGLEATVQDTSKDLYWF